MRTFIDSIGEFGLIKRFRDRIQNDHSVFKGSGDDCAVLKYTRNKYHLFTCDMLVEGVDFRQGENPYLIGRKALAVSLSDIAACGGIPRHCLVSLAMPKKTTIKSADQLFRGIQLLARECKINLVGGDLGSARELTIDISMLGEVEKKYLVLRSGAKPNDLIFVSGSLGGSIFGKHLKFRPRIKEARFLVRNFKINSMIDISDGLVQDLGHILEESKVGAVIYEDLIPISRQARGLADALYMGEDYELIFTLPAREAKRLIANKLFNFKAIGEISAGRSGLRLIDNRGREKNIRGKGFRHF
ncbi:thiamine-monophosphate kinase [bacterium]|nr:MAG: thiamine-monophosphate kinase [bacterium]